MEKAKKANRAQRKEKKKSSFKMIYEGVKIPKGQFIFAILISMVNYFLLSMTTDSAAKIVAGDIADFSVVITWAALHIAAYLLTIFEVSGTLMTLRVVNGVQVKLWNHVVHLPMRHYDRESPTRLISRVTSDANYAATPFSLAIASGAILVVFLFGLLSMSAVNETMLWVFIIGQLLVGAYTVGILGVARRAGAMITDRLSKFTAYLSERLSSIRLIKASASEEQEYAVGEEFIEQRYKAAKYNAFATLLSSISTNLGLYVQFIAAFFVGAIMLERGVLTDGTQIYTFYTFGMLMATSLAVFVQYPVAFAGMMGQVDSFTSVLKAEQEDTVSGEELVADVQDITLRNVNFAYAEEAPVLKNVDCVIRKGQTTAIVGANGSGKSTLMKIVDRLYPADSGDLLFGNVDASSVSLASWRARFGMVAQNASLFSGTVRENICYGLDRDVTEEELWAVAKASRIDELISGLPGGFEFDVGEAGSRLSGGEQQRVAIARAMMKNPDYLILDEATANLDAKTADEIQKSLKSLMQGRTTIMIAHSAAMVQDADNIIVLENGTVEACGTHQALLEKSAFYQGLIRGTACNG